MTDSGTQKEADGAKEPATTGDQSESDVGGSATEVNASGDRSEVDATTAKAGATPTVLLDNPAANGTPTENTTLM